MLHYEELSKELQEQIKEEKKTGCFADYSFKNENAIRRDESKDKPSIIRTPFGRDIDKILNCPFYNRYADKTQVFSLRRNDDITHRGLHVQLVSRIARTIGSVLNLNLELIEAIALGHDIGHTPFGHDGERFLDEIMTSECGRHFSHNIHSLRVLDGIFPYNITLQTLSGIASHDGELELSEYKPDSSLNFDSFDAQIEACYIDKANVRKLVPSTLEGCVVRISDIIAYLGKDRQDAHRMGLVDNDKFEDTAIGTYNAEIINNLVVNIIECSYGKPYIRLDDEHFEALKKAKADNYDLIYKSKKLNPTVENIIKPMMKELFVKLRDDLVLQNTASPIYTHHINYINSVHYERNAPYENNSKEQIVCDYIASMTDDYFIDLYNHLFPDKAKRIEYTGYFE